MRCNTLVGIHLIFDNSFTNCAYSLSCGLMEAESLFDAQPRPIVVPERVRAARELRGLTQGETVDLTGGALTAAALSQIETGKTRPTDRTVEALAEALQVPPAFFSSHWPSRGLDATPFFRHLRATSSKDRRRSGSLLLVLSDLVAAIETKTRLPQVDVPRLRHDAGSPRHSIAEAASQLRAQWGLDDEPISHVVREMERHGIVVARLTMNTSHVDAFSAHGFVRPLVLLADDKGSYARSRFDAAHELGHLVLHGSDVGGSQEVESQAHDFASAFLLPEHVAQQELPRTISSSTWQRLAELKRVWGMSISALLYRSHRLGLPDGEYRNAMKYMASKGWRRSEPGDREMGPPESPLLLERALRIVEVENGIALEDFLQDAGLPADVAIELIAAARDARPVVEF